MSRVLVVDDAAVDLQVAVGFVREIPGLEATTAVNGRDAIEQLAAHPVDIILTDLKMPDVDGLELVRHVTAAYPTVPVILMTSKGSEEAAVEALESGAASYIPKQHLRDRLGPTISDALEVAQAQKERQEVMQYMKSTESVFEVGYEPSAVSSLVSYFQDGMRTMDLCDENAQVTVGTALVEALRNAIDHGNLELDSSLREANDLSYWEVGRARQKELPYRDRRVHVTARLKNDEATYIIRDEGPGFDVSSLPDPTDPENLIKASGRGLLLIETFMDEVHHNAAGNELTLVYRRKTSGKAS